MTILWNKVTWYSKLIALVLLVVLPTAGFILGMEYQKARYAILEAKMIALELSRISRDRSTPSPPPTEEDK